MLTTDMPTGIAGKRNSVLGPAVLTTLVAGLAVALLAALLADAAAAYGALVGTAIAVGVFGFGSVVVDVASRTWPAISLLVALLTYVLQVVLMALVFAVLSRSGALDATLDRSWLAGAIIACAMCWVVAQIVVATTARIPVYDLPNAEPDAGAR